MDASKKSNSFTELVQESRFSTSNKDKKSRLIKWEVVRDSFLLAGVASIAFGLWQIYQPSAWIFLGSVVTAAAIAFARSDK